MTTTTRTPLHLLAATALAAAFLLGGAGVASADSHYDEPWLTAGYCVTDADVNVLYELTSKADDFDIWFPVLAQQQATIDNRDATIAAYDAKLGIALSRIEKKKATIARLRAQLHH